MGNSGKSATEKFKFWHTVVVQGYLCYKTITSQNIASEAQLRISFFHRKAMFCSWDV